MSTLREEEINLLLAALTAPTHEANDYNCEDWPIGEGCAGCKGDELRRKALEMLKREKDKP